MMADIEQQNDYIEKYVRKSSTTRSQGTKRDKGQSDVSYR